MPVRLIAVLRCALVCVAIIAELVLHDAAMVVLIATVGIVGRGLVMLQQSKAAAAARQAGVQAGITATRHLLATVLPAPPQSRSSDHAPACEQ
jgi:hypothetical protein